MWNFDFFPGTNKQKKELFVMAICTPTGKTFPGSYKIIPSSKKWVFHAIFRLAFVVLYGKKVCSLNRLVRTDKEDAEYRSFETMIATQCRRPFIIVPYICTFVQYRHTFGMPD
jgi:hypothetical protein